jgi:hypothetical protein
LALIPSRDGIDPQASPGRAESHRSRATPNGQRRVRPLSSTTFSGSSATPCDMIVPAKSTGSPPAPRSALALELQPRLGSRPSDAS